MKTIKTLITTATILTMTVLAASTAFAGEPYAVKIDADRVVLQFDVAEDPSRFIFDETPIVNGVPGYGNEFVSQGYIYPAGTLDGTDGVMPNGDPEYPNLVIGEWSCWGFHVGEGGASVGEPWVVTTQIYDFGDDDDRGRRSLISQGYELPDLNEAIGRAITGGTGEFATSRGQVSQELLGFNQAGGVVLRYEVELLDPKN